MHVGELVRVESSQTAMKECVAKEGRLEFLVQSTQRLERESRSEWVLSAFADFFCDLSLFVENGIALSSVSDSVRLGLEFKFERLLKLEQVLLRLDLEVHVTEEGYEGVFGEFVQLYDLAHRELGGVLADFGFQELFSVSVQRFAVFLAQVGSQQTQLRNMQQTLSRVLGA